MLSVQFDRWELPASAEVYLYDEARTTFIGAFNDSNRAPDGTMATAVVPGDAVVIEYRSPGLVPSGDLHVSSITHGLRDIFRFHSTLEKDYDPGYQSLPCEININCPEGSAWQAQKRSVAMFLRPDGHGCTGVLMNNTQTPGRPYFHVARHCYVATESQWVFYFNYEAPACDGTIGNTTQTLTGATLRADNYWTDLLLVELFNTPPPAYTPYYAGWDRSGNVPLGTAIIEHPLYDVKKIALNDDPCTQAVDPIGVEKWQQYWDTGITEPGASGAPVFDQNKRVVGFGYDGQQNCSNAATESSGCAKLSASWDGSSASSRLRDWLDPANTTVQLSGYDPGSSPTVKVRLKAFLEGPFIPATSQMSTALRTAGPVPLNEPYTGLGYVHVNGGGGESTTASVMAVASSNAVVDWVVVELRSPSTPSQVVATRSALLQADGDIVAVDGVSDVSLNAVTGAYHVAVRHRNHLGIMTASAHALSSTATLKDLSNGSVALYGGAAATKTVGSRSVMYSGDVNLNSILRYTGQANDRDPILQRIGGSMPTAAVTGYFVEDVNLDGVVRYVGSNNDRDPILTNIGGSLPTASRNASLP